MKTSAVRVLPLALALSACASTPSDPPLHVQTVRALEGEWLVEAPEATPAFLADEAGFPKELTNPPPLPAAALERAPTELRLAFLGGAAFDQVNDAGGYLLVRLSHPDLPEARTYVTHYAVHADPSSTVSLAPHRGMIAGGEGYDVQADGGGGLLLVPLSAGQPALRLRRYPSGASVQVPERLPRASR